FVQTAEPPVGHRQRVVNRRRLRHPFERGTKVSERFIETTLAKRHFAQAVLRQGRKNSGNAVELLPRLPPAIRSQIYLAETDSCRAIVRLRADRLLEAL